MKDRSVEQRRGVTSIELMVVSAILSLFLFGITNLARFGTMMWYRTDAQTDCKEAATRALLRLAPTLRSALRVDMGRSSASSVTVVLPLVDPATGRYMVPLEDGERVSFYLGDASGVPVSSGEILWRSVNDVPDRRWSLRDGRGIVVLQPGGLSFQYPTSLDPTSVIVGVSSSRTGGRETASIGASGEFFLRNRR